MELDPIAVTWSISHPLPPTERGTTGKWIWFVGVVSLSDPKNSLTVPFALQAVCSYTP